MKSLVIFSLICGIVLGLQRLDPLVSTKVGLIRGLRDENGYAKFLGVPYGKIDENNIFGAASPHPAFDNVFEAYDDSNMCIQAGHGTVTGNVECLVMNIYVPDTANSGNRLPVMVYIHGGAFVGGSSTAMISSPYSLVRHDVIFVGINYRLGIYGFMCLDIPEVPGNTGLKDQILALKWVKENIEAFGGDANQITIFGGSAGGMSVNLHLFTSHEKLFHRAIVQSGPANSYWMMVESDNTVPIRLAEGLGFNTNDTYEALSFLSNSDAHLVTLIADDLLITNGDGNNQPITKPCVEQKFEGIENFITEHPMNIKSSKANTTPVIIGHNSKEFAFQYATVDAEFFDTYDFDQLFALGFDMNNDLSEALETVKHFYIGDENISENVRWEIIDFGSDFIFNHPTQRMTQILLESGGNAVYSYEFSYSGSSNNDNKTWTGATHGDEVPYLFETKTGEIVKSSEEQLVADRLTTLWTNFAKYGDPTPQTSELLPVKWTPITKTTQPYLEIDSDLTLKNRIFRNRMAFWDLFYKQYGHLQKWFK